MNEILLFGTVGASFWDEECFTARALRETLASCSGPLLVRLNSGGGLAHEGQAIYSALRGYPGHVEIVIEGVAASAASLIAMAGDTITMTEGAVMMIHDPAQLYVEGRGTEEDHLQAARMLGLLAQAYAGIYAARAGVSLDEARAIMRAETYFDGPGAVAAGFASQIDPASIAHAPAAFDYRLYPGAPSNLRALAGQLSRQRAPSLVQARMVGIASPHDSKGKPMSKRNTTKTAAAPKALAGRPGPLAAQEDGEDQDAIAPEDDGEEDRAAKPGARRASRASGAGVGEDDGPEAASDDEPEAEEDAEEPDPEDDAGADDEDDDSPAGGGGSATARAHTVAILSMCALHGVETAQASDFIARGLTMRQVYDRIKNKGNSKVKIDRRGPRARISRDETDTRLEGMIGALMGRHDGAAAPYRGLRIKRLAMELGEQGGSGRGLRRFNDTDLVRSGMRATTMMGGAIGVSDFAYITSEVMKRSLIAEYTRRPPQWQLVCGQPVSAPDFRQIYGVRFGGDFQLRDVQENGEYQNAELKDDAESIHVKRRGRTITLSFEAIINDDMGAFARIPREFAQAARVMESSMVWSLFRGNRALKSDGKALFHADHGNLAAAGSAISVESIAAGRKAMSEMRAFGSKDPDDFIASEAELLIVPPALELQALQFTADIVPNRMDEANPYRSRFQAHAVPHLGAVAGGSDSAWYLIDPDLPPIQHAYLDGYEAPTIETIDGMNPDAVKMNARHIFGAAAIEYRGAYKDPGQ